MRKILPKVGTYRIINKFLIFPLSLRSKNDGELRIERYLERVEIVQVYSDLCNAWINRKWNDI